MTICYKKMNINVNNHKLPFILTAVLVMLKDKITTNCLICFLFEIPESEMPVFYKSRIGTATGNGCNVETGKQNNKEKR
jgi:hypothetical protein